MAPTDDVLPPPDDALQRYLAARGLPIEARQRGLRGLVRAWESVARGAADYDLTLDDWRNDLDLRDIIAGAFALAPPRAQREVHDLLERADAQFRAGTTDAGRPLWGMPDSSMQRETAAGWWYRRRPAQPGDTMRAALEAAGISSAR
jgi:hypothetical protein